MWPNIAKHLEFRQDYSAPRRIFNSLFSVRKCGETQSYVFDLLFPPVSSLVLVSSVRHIFNSLLGFVKCDKKHCLLRLMYYHKILKNLYHILHLLNAVLISFATWSLPLLFLREKPSTSSLGEKIKLELRFALRLPNTLWAPLEGSQVQGMFKY